MEDREMGEEVHGEEEEEEEEEEEDLTLFLPRLEAFAISRQPSATDIPRMSDIDLMIYLAQVSAVAAQRCSGTSCLPRVPNKHIFTLACCVCRQVQLRRLLRA
jgi:hypothetical protein